MKSDQSPIINLEGSLPEGHRGLVVSPPVAITGQTVHVIDPALDGQELRSNLLFWDVLDRPQNNIMDMGISPDERELVAAGVMVRSKVNFRYANGADALIDTVLAVDRSRSSSQDGMWSLATGKKTTHLTSSLTKTNDGVMVSLLKSIPVPNVDVPVHEVLDFRRRRRDELLDLRYHLEGLCRSVYSAGDKIDLALEGELHKLGRAIDNHRKAVSEARFMKRFLNLGMLVKVGVPTAVAYATEGGLTATVGSGIAANLAVETYNALADRKVSPSPFQYISRYEKELFT